MAGFHFDLMDRLTSWRHSRIRNPTNPTNSLTDPTRKLMMLPSTLLLRLVLLPVLARTSVRRKAPLLTDSVLVDLAGAELLGPPEPPLAAHGRVGCHLSQSSHEIHLILGQLLDEFRSLQGSLRVGLGGGLAL
ncbi:hypothetical protein PG996_005123 [Apiospora saccharicola]|uniref:Uncharacterized protein n=1 Tax=Apiospora saccharicola TaxID=335842 RepID=A0ABR1VKL6_9PEZI